MNPAFFSRASHGYYNVRRENADREHLRFVLAMLKSVLKEVGVRGSGDRGPGQGRRPLWAPSHPLLLGLGLLVWPGPSSNR